MESCHDLVNQYTPHQVHKPAPVARIPPLNTSATGLRKIQSITTYDEMLSHSLSPKELNRNTEKQQRLCNSLHLGDVLYAHCCTRQCISNLVERPETFEQHLRLWTGLPQQTLSRELAKLLAASKVDVPTSTSVKLQGSMFDLQWNGIPLCGKAFQLLYGISRRKIIAASRELHQEHQHGNSIVDHENTLTHSILNFLDDIKSRCGSQCDSNPNLFYLNGFYEKRQLWKHYVDTRQDNEDVASDSHFLAVWTHYRPHYVTESDAMKCATCAKYDNLLSSSSLSEAETVTIRADKQRHKEVKTCHLDRLRSLIARAKRGDLLMLIGDHMRSKGIPKLKHNNMNILMSELINIHFSGWFNPYTGKSNYYLFPEHWSECANSIISCLHSLLKSVQTPLRKLVLVFDNHSTQHNNALLAYCDWLVRYKHLFDEIEVLFLIAGHTKNSQDQMNSYVAAEYMKRQFFSVEDLCTLRNDRREFEEQKHILQWVEKFSPIMNTYSNIFRAHVFLFTAQGMKTKEFVDDVQWNQWNKLPVDAHHLMLSEEPKGLLEPMAPYKLGDKKIKDAKSSLAYIPNQHQIYLSNLILGNFGYQLQAVDALADLTPHHSNPITSIDRPAQFRLKKRQHSSIEHKLANQKKSPAAMSNITEYDETLLESGEVADLLESLQPEEQTLLSKHEEHCRPKKKKKSVHTH